MAAIGKSARVCEKCGSPIDTTSAGDLGCIACLIATGLDAEAEQSETAFASASDQLGAYTIEHHADGSAWELGHGGMGVTYRAIDKALDRPVALKIINTNLGTHSAEARERFMREARAAAALRHPNVATVYQFGVREEIGQFFYAMELVEGETLEERVRRLGPLDVLTTIDIALQVAAALEAAEERGLVHRDLKPGNLMLVAADTEEVGTPRWGIRTAQRAVPTVKVIDFGVAKAAAEKTDAMALTHGGFVGTPAFASPEQFTNAPVDVRSDIYSLGAALWFLLTGHMLFSGQTIEEIRDARRSKPLPIEQLRAAHVPRRLISLLVSMLAIEPAARPAGARELSARLQAIRASITGRGKTAARLALAAAIVALATIVGVRQFHSTKATPSPIPEKTIAVLPFENLSPDADSAYFADGIEEGILTRLASIADLKVISHTSTQRYKSESRNLRQIAKQLGVANILEGSVQKAGNQVRVNVQLINAQTDSHLWADTYDRKLTDVFLVETDIAKTIADSLKAKLTRSERQAIAVRPTANPEAYELYLKGRFFWNKRTGADLRQAIDYFNQAIAKDPNYALAYAGLADCYDLLHEYSDLSPKESYPKAKAAAIKALELDDTLGEAHTSLAYSLINYDWDWRSAEREYQRAIQLDPNYATAHQWYAECLSMLGRHSEAIAEIKKAHELDPLSLIINQGVGGKYMYARRYDEAMAQFRRTLELYPHFPPTHQRLGWCYVQKRMYDEAIAEMRRAVELSGNSAQMIAALGHAHAAAGRRETARGIIAELERRSKESYVDHYFVATIFAALGEKDEAFALLEKAYAERSYWMPWLNIDPQFDNLRSDSRFDELVERVLDLNQ
jgi:serine/threonine protein kinase